MSEIGMRKSTFTRAVRSLLECTICLDPCASPIHSCDNGHLICGICFDKMKNDGVVVKCPICQCESIAVNALAERQSRQNDMLGVCPYTNSGCEERILAANLKAHLPTCEYRDIKCTTNRTCKVEGCAELCALSPYPMHLNRVHEIVMSSKDGFLTRFAFNKMFNPNDPMSKNYWDVEPPSKFFSRVVEFDGRHFALQAVARNRLFYWWLTIFSGQKEADRYISYSDFICTDKKRMPSFQYILPVLPFNSYEKYDENCGHYGIIHAATLTNFSELAHEKYHVGLRLKIKKLPEGGSEDDAKKRPANDTEGDNLQNKNLMQNVDSFISRSNFLFPVIQE